jgi:hypothetical protein
MAALAALAAAGWATAPQALLIEAAAAADEAELVGRELLLFAIPTLSRTQA